MEIFKQLKKLGYKHYIDLTIEELDALSINDIEKRIEYSLVVDWFREKYNIYIWVSHYESRWYQFDISINRNTSKNSDIDFKLPYFNSYYEAREQAILKAIELCQNKKS